MGTLAHEVMSITGQLLACFDDEAGGHANPCHPSPDPSLPAGPLCNGNGPAACKGESSEPCVDPGFNAEPNGDSHGEQGGAVPDSRGGALAEAGASSRPGDSDGHWEGARPVAVSALLAHLLFLRANGGLVGATALADTFGTAAFAAAAAAARVPDEFVEDMRRMHPDEPPIAPGPQPARARLPLQAARCSTCCSFFGWSCANMQHWQRP